MNMLIVIVDALRLLMALVGGGGIAKLIAAWRLPARNRAERISGFGSNETRPASTSS
jgi:hypothetical protein